METTHQAKPGSASANNGSQVLFSNGQLVDEIRLSFLSIEETLFYSLMPGFADAPVSSTQSLNRAVVSGLVGIDAKFVWPIDRLLGKHKWNLVRTLTKEQSDHTNSLDYVFGVESVEDDPKLRKVFYGDDMLAASRVRTATHQIDVFSIDQRLHKEFQQCTETKVVWTRQVRTSESAERGCSAPMGGMGNSLVPAGLAGAIVSESLEKIIHKNGRYDYNYCVSYLLGRTSGKEAAAHNVDVINSAITAFESFITRYLCPTINALLEDAHKRQIWCDGMLSLKASRLFTIYSEQLSEDTLSRLKIRPSYMAHKIDGERCFGFLFSHGLLVVSSKRIEFLRDVGLANLKQSYYVIVERIDSGQHFIIDVAFMLRFSSNLNPNFTSNNKMFETNLLPVQVSVLDAIKFIGRLPTTTLRKNYFTPIDDPSFICGISPPEAAVPYDGMLAIVGNTIYKVKKNQTIELEVCLRSLLLDKLNDSKPQPMHKFLKQWKKRKIIVAEELFAAFPHRDLQHLFFHVYMRPKERFTLAPITWGAYADDPQRFILDMFSTSTRRSARRPHSLQVLEILNTRVVAEFTCIVEQANSDGAASNSVRLEFLRKRYDKLQADPVYKVKSMIASLGQAKPVGSTS